MRNGNVLAQGDGQGGQKCTDSCKRKRIEQSDEGREGERGGRERVELHT